MFSPLRTLEAHVVLPVTNALFQGVRHRYDATHADSPTLEQLAVHERKSGQREATACLVRLIRCVPHVVSRCSRNCLTPMSILRPLAICRAHVKRALVHVRSAACECLFFGIASRLRGQGADAR